MTTIEEKLQNLHWLYSFLAGSGDKEDARSLPLPLKRIAIE
jgi:hypothetical protein